MDDELVEAYLRRIGAQRPKQADAAALAYLQERHLMSVPYENIDTHFRRPLPLGAAAVDKVVRKHRGGGCRELNGSTFPELLRALGFDVDLLGGRVYYGDRLGTLLGHVVIVARTPELWLVDVGFGRSSRRPLRLDSRAPQIDPHGTFQLRDAPYGDLDLYCDGRPVYRIEPGHPRTLDDLAPILRWAERAPDTPIYERLYCSLVTEHGRVTLSGDVVIRTEHGQRTKKRLDSDAEVLEAYRTLFGIALDRLPPVPSHDVDTQMQVIEGVRTQ